MLSSYRITARISENPRWADFTIDPATGPEKKQLFRNIDEAKQAPIVQQLFYLPFVKSVHLSKGLLHVERFDILQWEEVLEEVREQLETYLNEGGELIKETNTAVTVYAESTPNPEVMKFVANKQLVSAPMEFKTSESATDNPLIEKLFALPFVKEVFVDTNYISITKTSGEAWDALFGTVRELIWDALKKGESIVENSHHDEVQDRKEEREWTDMEKEITAILEEYIKPAVASDGGNIVLQEYNATQKSVHVILQGACSGCPSSTITLKNGIETMLKDMLPGKVETVEAVNG